MAVALTWEQTAREAWKAGFRNLDLTIITAIAYAESRLNPNPPGNPTHYGILQFDAATAKQAKSSVTDVLNPSKAFQAAYNLVYGVNGAPKRGFQPWKGDGYENYMRQASHAVLVGIGLEANSGSAQTTGSDGPLPSVNIPNPFDIPGAIAQVAQNIKDAPATAAKAGGAALGNALMDAGRSLLPYALILVIVLFGVVLVYSGIAKQEISSVTGGLAGGR